MRKILIATTSEAINIALSEALSQYEVHTCDTGTDTLALLETLRPDILILSLILPVMDGLTVLQETSFKPRIILALTNFAAPAVLQAAAAAGAQDIILIPCTTRYIIDRLDALIEKFPSLEV